jgi:hypothetical protein
MSEPWVRQTLTAELLSDAHLGSGSGGSGIDALVAQIAVLSKYPYEHIAKLAEHRLNVGEQLETAISAYNQSVRTLETPVLPTAPASAICERAVTPRSFARSNR